MTFESLSFAARCDLCSVILCGDRELIEFSGGFSGVSIPLFPRQWDYGIQRVRYVQTTSIGNDLALISEVGRGWQLPLGVPQEDSSSSKGTC